MKKAWLIALLASLVVVAVACGDDKTATPAPTTSPTTAPTSSATATATPAETGTPSATETASETATETATESATASETATPSETATASGDRDALIAQFPADAQELVGQVWSTDLIALLLKVRQEGPGTIVWQDGGGEFNEGQKRAFLNDWQTITGWTVNSVSTGGTPNLSVLEEQMGNGGKSDWDVTEINGYADADRDGKFFQDLDATLYPAEYYQAGVLTAPNWVSVINYGTVLVYNTDVFPDPATAPQSLSDMFDLEKFPDAKRCLYDGAQYGWNLEYALLADGVAPADLYATLGTDEGVKRAFAKLDTIKDNAVYWATGAESIQFILDGQCDMGTTWNGRPALRIKDEPDLPLGVSWKGALLDGDPFGIPTSVEGTQLDAAQSALAFALQPQSQCDLENELAYGQIMSVEPFPDCLTDFAKKWGPQPDLMLPFPPDPVFWSANATKFSDAWAAWKTQ